MKALALFMVDSRPSAGLGHLVRCRALAAELVSRGWETRMIATDTTTLEDHAVLIVDVRADLRQYLAPPRCVQIVDDTSPVSPCEILVNGTAAATVDMYAGSGAVRVLAGPKFSLLRPEFSAVAQGPRAGVVDLREISGWTAQTIAEKLASARVAVTYGGMRAMECACVGIPMVVIPRNLGEKMNSDGLLAAGCCVVATDSEATVMAETMLECPRLLDKMGENARALVDGKGCKRVASAIEAFV